MAVRTFIAVDIDDSARSALSLAAGLIEPPDAKINWVQPANLHVTLKFLGDVEDSRLDEVCRAVAEAASQVEPFEFDVHSLLAVPPRGKVRMLWGGVDDPTGRMAELHAAMEGALEKLGFAPEGRQFRPHITLARIKFARDSDAIRAAASAFAQEHFGTVRAEEVTVYSSKLTPDGPIYTPLTKALFGTRMSE